MGVVGFGMIVVMVLLAVFAPWLAPYNPAERPRVSIDSIYAPPSSEHPWGTDDAGRDVLSNFMFGARVSLIVGFFASLISVFIGGVIGLTAGYVGGRTENLLMRFTDIMLVIPDLPLAVVLVALTKPGLINIILVIGILGWTGTARLVRSQTLSVKERKFVQACSRGRRGERLHHPLARPAFSLALDGRQLGAGHFAGDSQREHPQFSGPLRPDDAQLGADAQLRLYARGDERGRVVGAPRAGLRHRLAGLRLYAFGARARGGPQPALSVPSPHRQRGHGRRARARGRGRSCLSLCLNQKTRYSRSVTCR